ncbi:MAG: hypothetical protein DRO14_06255 [Thermoprotei archaeon]|nr:MAG: hypothetical protein DRO14_06255 [Thermoprotei archaeon]
MAYQLSVGDVLASLEEELRWLRARLDDIERRLAEVEGLVREALDRADEALEAVGELELSQEG